MAYDRVLAERIRAMLAEHEPTERQMFGGFSFLVRGNLACGVMGRDMIVRISKEDAARALREEPFVRPFDFTGRPMRNSLYVAADGIEADEDLRGWVERGVAHALTLPPK